MTGLPRTSMLEHCARAIPFWVVPVLLLGCLDDPPTFAPRGQVPPFIIAGQVEPPLGAIYEGPSTFSLNIPFRSEDVNNPLEARVYLDLVPGIAANNAFDRVFIPPGNFEELRYATLDWTAQIAGCHSLTVVITDAENYDLNGLPLDDTLAARVVWWTNIGDTNRTILMANCPGASQIDDEANQP